MAIVETNQFTFASQGLAENTFSVVKFKGVEGISKLYEFDITLASDDAEITLKDVLQNTAILTVKGSDQDLPVHGAVVEFEQLHETKGHCFYRALLVPRLWQASLYHENQLFLDKKVPDIIEEILKQTGLTSQDYELKLTGNYPEWEYICQYNETDFDFISRWMEREGIYYYFEQGEKNEKLIITDSSTAHKDISGDVAIPYFATSGLAREEEAIKAFVCTQKMLPKKVILKDYNYRKPSLEIKGEAEVDAKGRGEVYIYGEHFKDPGQGNGLAKIRAEEIKCRENIFHGEGTASNMYPGFFFELEECYRDSYNRKYLILEVEHEGHQTGAMWAGMGGESVEGEEKLTYANRFAAIPSDIQFRPERKTPKSKFIGMINATVDAAGDGKDGEVDDQGRYKIILPFDQSGNKDGKASRWVRMAQPYAGSDYGMHFPLHKGAEVLLTFVDGDPDRPIISGAIPNPETTSPVTDANQTKSVIRDNYGNELVFDATPGDEHIRLQTPHHNSGLELGRSSTIWTTSDENSIILGNQFEIGAGMKTELFGGMVTELKLGVIYDLEVGTKLEFNLGGSFKYDLAWESTYCDGPITSSTKMDILSLSGNDQVLGAGHGLGLIGGSSANQGQDSRSIANLYPEELALSVGPMEVRNKETGTTYQGQLYDDYLPKKTWKMPVLFAVATVAAALPTFGLFFAQDQPDKKEDETFVPDWLSVSSLTLGSVIGLLGLLYGTIRLGLEKKSERETRIEPVVHSAPAAEIKMKNDGEITVKSKNGEQKIELEVYKDDDSNTLMSTFRMKKNKILIRGGHENDSKIFINPGGGIIFTNSKGKGQIQLFSKEKIVLDSKKQINLQADAIFKKKIEMKNFKVS